MSDDLILTYLENIQNGIFSWIRPLYAEWIHNVLYEYSSEIWFAHARFWVEVMVEENFLPKLEEKDFEY